MKILQDEDIHTLLILECLPEDAGNYTIEIVSSSGKKTHCFRIDVEGKMGPAFIVTFADHMVST